MDRTSLSHRDCRQQREYLDAVAAQVNDRFLLADVGTDGRALADGGAVFLHRETQLPFHLILPEPFVFGMTDTDLGNLKQLFAGQFEPHVDPASSEGEFHCAASEIETFRPASVRRISHPLLVARLPLLGSQMAQLLPGYAIGDENEQEEFAHYPAAVGFAEATAACKRLGCRLPTEVEWEYLCRAGTETLFLWGDSLPWDETGEDAPWLDGWLRQECADQAALTANGFGLQCLMGAEWCQDPYTEGHAAEAPTRPGFRVAKAGGGASYPGWQVYEWLWCLPTWRHAIPESFTSEAIRQLLEIDHHTPAARPVFEVMLDT